MKRLFFCLLVNKLTG
uniref:Uncharacterized protein n=1 Tax=Rhizophora mucronata TaxID=61149 RepID=A0A2P2IJH0_RHIMU